MTRQEFSRRIRELRELKGVSGREMSADLGQSPGYVNNIENGVILPSMQMFFDICSYFRLTPEQFFYDATPNVRKIRELSETMADMSSEQCDVILSVARMLQSQASAVKLSG